MTQSEEAQCGPLPGWTPADLAEAVGCEPLVVLEGVDLHGERYALVGWGLSARAASVAEAVRLAAAGSTGDGSSAAGSPRESSPGAADWGLSGGAPALLDAVVGSLDWDGTAYFWHPASAVLFLPEQGRLWWRGQLPASLQGNWAQRSGAGGSPGLANAEDDAGSGSAASATGKRSSADETGARTSAGKPGAATAVGTPGSATSVGTPGSATSVGTPGAAAPAGTPGAATSAGKPGRTTSAGTSGAVTPAGARSPAVRAVRLLWDQAGYCAAVREAQRQMAAGHLQKVILSLPMEADWEAPPLLLYRRLTSAASAGLRFYLDGGDGRGALMGISPEPLVGLVGGQVRMRLLAGTRKQQPGAERDLAASAKDRHEHTVAVEQARQDLLTVCRPESVAVPAFLEVERHPGLVHLASSLIGRLREDAGPQDLVTACFPASTVGGIPRDRAASVIQFLEPLPRDWYAGAVGLVLPGGDLDLWLTIRSLRYRDGVVQFRTGAGLVPESDPTAEWQECLNKAAHILAALGGEIREQ